MTEVPSSNNRGTGGTEESVSVLVVDDHAIWREGMHSILRGTEFRILGEASSGTDAIALAGVLRPQIVLLDIRMAGGDGLQALQAIKSAQPQTAVVMLTVHEHPAYLARAVAGGAAGYLLKGVGRRELLGGLRLVAQGETLLRPEELTLCLRDLKKDEYPPLLSPSSVAEPIAPLSRQEQSVLGLIADGLSNRGIAAILFISENTVKTHVRHIITKLGVSDRVQAAVWAVRHGGYAVAVPDPYLP